MNSMMTMDRGMTGMGTSGNMMMNMMPGMMNMMPGMMNMLGGMPMPGMMPRCTMKMEKCVGGMKCMMTCDDKTAAEMLKNLCMMMQGGMCSMCCMCSGMMCCCHNMGMMGMCKMEMTDMGCTMMCTSGDKNCEMMIQACCDCMMKCMMAPGCCCMMMMNGMPMCCSMMM